MKKITFLILFTQVAFGQDRVQKIVSRMDSLFNVLEKTKQLNGNVLVAENGKVIYQKSFGYADFENKILLNENSEFTIASITKTFTSAAILQLKEQGKLNLDDYIIKYFPNFPYPNITIRNLLTHTSALPDFSILYQELIDKDTNRIIYNKDVIPALIAWKTPLDFKPGEKWAYSNTNYNLLALLVEKLSGISFKNYIAKNIFSPSNMKHSYFRSDTEKATGKNTTYNYEYPFYYSPTMQKVSTIWQERLLEYNLMGLQGDGDIISTTTDLLNFDDALYNGKILKQTTLKEAFTPFKYANGETIIEGFTPGDEKVMMGLGWFIYADTSLGKIVGHTGGLSGSTSILLRNITKKQTIIETANINTDNRYRTAINILNMLNNNPNIYLRKRSLIQDYGATLVEKGVDAAFCKLIELKADTVHYKLIEDDLNALGSQLYNIATFNNYKQLAIEAFKLNILLFPQGYNTYDTYGAILRDLGKNEEAILMYKKSLELNPESQSGKKALQELNFK